MAIKRFPRGTPLAEKLRLKSKAGPKGCLLWTGHTNADGYGEFSHEGKMVRAHRKAWEVANGRAVPAGLEVCHSCDVPACIEPSHLSAETHQKNVADRDARKRRAPPQGEKNGNAILTAEVVRKIRMTPGKHRDLAALFSTSKSNITGILSGNRWAHVQQQGD